MCYCVFFHTILVTVPLKPVFKFNRMSTSACFSLLGMKWLLFRASIKLYELYLLCILVDTGIPFILNCIHWDKHVVEHLIVTFSFP